MIAIAGGVFAAVGLVTVTLSVRMTWRAQAAVRRRARSLSAYSLEELVRLGGVSDKLNQDGVALEQTLLQLAPRLRLLRTFLDQPVVSATVPWILRRLLGRPLRRRG